MPLPTVYCGLGHRLLVMRSIGHDRWFPGDPPFPDELCGNRPLVAVIHTCLTNSPAPRTQDEPGRFQELIFLNQIRDLPRDTVLRSPVRKMSLSQCGRVTTIRGQQPGIPVLPSTCSFVRQVPEAVESGLMCPSGNLQDAGHPCSIDQQVP